MQTPATPPIPHVGGPILPPGVPTVLIGGMPAAVMGGMATCVGPPDSIILGSTGVLIGGQPAARMGDSCAHGGTIVVGMPTVLIGETMPGVPPVVVPPVVVLAPAAAEAPAGSQSAQAQALTQAAKRGRPFCEVCTTDQEEAQEREKQKDERLSWVAFTLVDETGKPVAGEKYRLQIEEGGTKEGVTNIKGEVRVDGVKPGKCKISFPDLGIDDWEIS